MKDGEITKLFIWVKMGSQRRNVLGVLGEGSITAEEFRQAYNKNPPKVKLSLREVSRHFTSFEEEGIMKCLNPDAPYMKHYQLTPLGKKIQEKLKRYKPL